MNFQLSTFGICYFCCSSPTHSFVRNIFTKFAVELLEEITGGLGRWDEIRNFQLVSNHNKTASYRLRLGRVPYSWKSKLFVGAFERKLKERSLVPKTSWHHNLVMKWDVFSVRTVFVKIQRKEEFDIWLSTVYFNPIRTGRFCSSVIEVADVAIS